MTMRGFKRGYSGHIHGIHRFVVGGSVDSPGVVGVCRWDAANSELVSDEVGIAYPVVNGVPHLKPESGRVIDKPQPGSKEDEIPMQPS